MNTRSTSRAFTGLAFALAASSALAAVNLPKEGTYDVNACWSGTSSDITVSKDFNASSYEMTGTIMSNVGRGGLGDQSTFRCVGLRTMIKGQPGGANVCEVTDADGDKRMNRFETLADGKVVREMVTGTGKYEGMTQTNTVALFPPMKEAKPGTFQGCNRQTGSYKLK